MKLLRFNEHSNLNRLPLKSLIQIKEDGKNVGQAKIIKTLKTLYHIRYKSNIYKVKISDLEINKHGQVQLDIDRFIGEHKINENISGDKHWFNDRTSWEDERKKLKVDDDENWSKYENEIIAFWYVDREEGWVKK